LTISTIVSVKESSYGREKFIESFGKALRKNFKSKTPEDPIKKNKYGKCP